MSMHWPWISMHNQTKEYIYKETMYIDLYLINVFVFHLKRTVREIVVSPKGGWEAVTATSYNLLHGPGDAEHDYDQSPPIFVKCGLGKLKYRRFSFYSAALYFISPCDAKTNPMHNIRGP